MSIHYWLRYEHAGRRGFGTLEGTTIAVHTGDMFAGAEPTGERLDLGDVRLLTPTEPTKFLALWNNFTAMQVKMELATPPEPLYFLKSPNSYLAGGELIRTPASYPGRVIFEGEIGIVIGRETHDASIETAAASIFGYTCVNDVTALDVLFADASFPQWTRSKGYDTFGVFGPVVTTGLDPAGLHVRTILDGVERQNYPVSDMMIDPVALVAKISGDMTLHPGDVIACGTSVGAGKMKPGCTIEVVIEGIGTLRNRFE